MSRPTIVFADDHGLVASGISKLLEEEFELMRIVADGRELLDAVRELKPDVALMDISMPVLNGIEAARQIRAENLDTKIVILTMHTGLDYVSEAFRAGANAYVLKSSSPDELPAAVRSALRGKPFLSTSIPATIADVTGTHSHPLDPLTSRQRQVLQLIAEGHSAKEVAAVLGISPKTAEFHKTRIMDRLSIRSTAELTRYAIEKRISPGEDDQLE
jgi:DNA-binding NarL/FixJ family response regulator